MSAKVLIIRSELEDDIRTLTFKFEDGYLKQFDSETGPFWEIDRTEAHLLMLYLQEHLK